MNFHEIKHLPILILALGGFMLMGCSDVSSPSGIMTHYQSSRSEFEKDFDMEFFKGKIQIIPGEVVLAKDYLKNNGNSDWMNSRAEQLKDCFQVNLQIQLKTDVDQGQERPQALAQEMFLRELYQNILLTANQEVIKPLSKIEEGRKHGSRSHLVVYSYEIPAESCDLSWHFMGTKAELIFELPSNKLTNYPQLKI